MGLASADTVTITPGAPVQPELAAELIHATEPHIFGHLHGHDMALVRGHMGHQWQQSDGLFSHRYARMALWQEQLVGIEVGYDLATQEAAGAATVAQALAYLTPEQFEPWVRWREYGRYVLPPLPEDAWYLQHLAVIAQARGRGVGERLLDSALERCRQAGHARVHLDIYVGNPAQRLYERMGFEVIVETVVRPLLPLGIPAHLRMERRL